VLVLIRRSCLKRALTKKVKAYPASVAGDDASERYFKLVQPEVKRRVRTSAAMIGLAISMGTSSILLTRQSARGAIAAEPGTKTSTLSIVPTATVTAPSLPINPIQKVTLKRLKQKSHRARYSLAKLNSESNNSFTPSIPTKTPQINLPTVVGSQLVPSVAKQTPQSNPYVQNLQTEIQRLWEKYPAQQTGSQVLTSVTKPTAAKVILAHASGTIPSESTNREFRIAQAAALSQPAVQKFPSAEVNSPVPVRATQPIATAPINVDSSGPLQSSMGQKVSPELPPLAAGDTYLPKPFPASTPFKGYIWPAKGVVTSPYGWRWGRMHKGIDIAAPIGTPVFAAAPGVVVTAGWNSGGYGNLVDVQHADGSLTRYAHNYRIMVQVGQLVAQGQEISEMGTSGYSTGPHCHFEVHPRGHGAVNPIAYLPR